MSRRSKGEGSLRQRPDGRWEARYNDAGGRRRSIYGASQKEARAALKDALRRIDAGQPATDSKMLLKDWGAHWLTHVIKPAKAPRTHHSYAERWRIDIDPALGDTQIGKLTTEQIERWRDALLAQEAPRRSPRTVAYGRTILHAALDEAVRRGLIVRNPAALAAAPAVPRTRFEPFTVEEAQALINSLRGTRWEAFYQLALGLGLRRGELIGLRVADLDLERGRLSVRKAKTKAGVRTLNLPDFLRVALAAHLKRQQVEASLKPALFKEGWLFPSQVGTKLGETPLRRTFKLHLKKAGLREIRFHDLRHACASYLLNEGVPLKAVSAILGHAQTSTTSEIYWHLTNGSEVEALNKGSKLAG